MIAAMGSALAVIVAAVARGRVHPDEIFQFLEPAHHAAFGDWMPAWEWFEGLRNWAFPGLLAGLLRACAAAGVAHPWILAAAVWVACAAIQAAGTAGVYRLVEERDGAPAAALAAVVHATWGGYAIYAARPLGDVVSVTPLVWALVHTRRSRDHGGWFSAAQGGVFLGLAFVVRYPTAVFGLPLAMSMALARRGRALGAFLTGGAAVFAGLGVLDLATWGTAWQTVGRFVLFNASSDVVTGQFGRQPWWWYGPTLAAMVPLLLTWHFVRGLGRRDVVVGAFAAYFVFLMVLPHKEPRFLVPLVPLWVAIAARPAADDLARLCARSRAALPSAVVLHLIASVMAATVLLPFGLHRAMVDATVECGRDEGFRGLVVAGPAPWNTAGRFYLHREGPLYLTFNRPEGEVRATLSDPRYTHVIVEGGALAVEELDGAGFSSWRALGDVVIWRRFSATARRAPTPFG